MKRLMICVVVAIVCTHTTALAANCDRLKNATPEQLTAFLSSVPHDDANVRCVVFAIDKLGEQHYLPAAPVLIDYLELKWPLNARKLESSNPNQVLAAWKRGEIGPRPAADALKKIGVAAAPDLMNAIKSPSYISPRMQAIAEVWMDFYKSDSPKGVSLLKQESKKSSDKRVKENFAFAIFHAVENCNRTEIQQCREAAQR